MRQRWLLWAGIGLCVLTVFSELYLRFDGYKCEGDAGYLYRYEGFDPYLGWRNRIGHNKSSEYTDINPCYENVWPDGSRVSRRDRDKKASKRVLLLGCSYTFGMGVPDEQTFAWRLNERFPDIAFDNFGVPAYGTYQSMLMEKKQLLERHYDLVVYSSFIDHLTRNVCWGNIDGNLSGKAQYIMNPKVSQGKDGELRYYSYIRRWPGDDLLAGINFLKRIYYMYLVRRDAEERAKIIDSLESKLALWNLLLRMDQLAKEQGGRFAATWLNGGVSHMRSVMILNAEQAREFFPNEADDYVLPKDADFPAFPLGGPSGEEESLELHNSHNPGHHYNGIVHARWAKTLGDWIESSWDGKAPGGNGASI